MYFGAILISNIKNINYGCKQQHQVLMQIMQQLT